MNPLSWEQSKSIRNSGAISESPTIFEIEASVGRWPVHSKCEARTTRRTLVLRYVNSIVYCYVHFKFQFFPASDKTFCKIEKSKLFLHECTCIIYLILTLEQFLLYSLLINYFMLNCFDEKTFVSWKHDVIRSAYSHMKQRRI